MIWTSKELEKALSVKPSINGEFGKVQFNSIDIQKNDIFIALKGNRDGHDFVKDAFDRGASLAIVTKHVQGVDKSRQMQVEDTFEALMDLAEYKRRNSKAKFIAITGSVGKTSTKEATKIMLSAYGRTHASHGTFNNHLGVPLCLASMPNDSEYVVVEMGMSKKGELSELSRLVIPDVSVITTVSEGHIEFFNSVEEIADAKCEIFEGIDINDGIAIVNRDISTYERCLQNIDRAGIQNVQTYGKRLDSGVRFVSSVVNGDKIKLVYSISGREYDFIMPVLPIHLARNFAAALAVVRALKLDPEPAIDAISTFEPLLGRGKLVSSRKGTKEFKIICDYYNANPQSMVAALEYMSILDSSNKIAILGDMAGLGKFSYQLHMSIVPNIKDIGLRKLFLVGEKMKTIRTEFGDDVEVFCFDDTESLCNNIDQYLTGGEVILIKGSRVMGLEKVVNRLGVENAF